MKKRTNYTGPKRNGMPRWKCRLDDYRTEELAWLIFPTEEDAHAALDLVWVGRLQGMPFNFGGDPSLVVPKRALPYFTQAGIRFRQKPGK